MKLKMSFNLLTILSAISLLSQGCGASFEISSTLEQQWDKKIKIMMINFEAPLTNRDFFRSFRENVVAQLKQNKVEAYVIEGNRLFANETVKMKIDEYQPDLILKISQFEQKAIGGSALVSNQKNPGMGIIVGVERQKALYNISLITPQGDKILWSGVLSIVKFGANKGIEEGNFTTSDGKELAVKLIDALKADSLFKK